MMDAAADWFDVTWRSLRALGVAVSCGNSWPFTPTARPHD